MNLSGQITTTLAGVDYSRGKWLSGLIVSRSTGTGEFEDASSEKGKLRSSLQAATAFGNYKTTDRSELWGAGGYGRGELALTSPSGLTKQADLDWQMAAAGSRTSLLKPERHAGFDLALISDSLWVRTASDEDILSNLAATEADVARVRLGLEGSWIVAGWQGSIFVPKLELALRQDFGDAETGTGVDASGGVEWAISNLGLRVDLTGRTLVAHTDEDFKNSGYAASIAFDPNSANDQGLSVALRHQIGAESSGGIGAMFANDPINRMRRDYEAGRWVAEAAWGLAVFDSRYVGSPHIAIGLASDNNDYALGWRLVPEKSYSADIFFDFQLTRRESGEGSTDHGLELQIDARF